MEYVGCYLLSESVQLVLCDPARLCAVLRFKGVRGEGIFKSVCVTPWKH